MLWHEQSWQELDQIDRNTPVVIPLGACEQHGHHLPLFVDTIQVTTLAERVEREMGDKVLLAPTLWLGSSHHHRDYPGTLSLAPSNYTKVIQSLALSTLAAGFRRVFFLNGHGGNEIPGSQALAELVAENDDADQAYLALASWWGVGVNAIDPQTHGMTTPFVSHACEYETSMMLALRPDLVSPDKIAEAAPVLDSPWFNFEHGGKVNVFRRYRRLTPSGSMGSPSAATAEKGQAMFDAVVTDVIAFLRDFATWPDLPAVGPA